MSEEVTTTTGSVEPAAVDTSSILSSGEAVSAETAAPATSSDFDFRTHLDDDLRNNPSLESIKDVNNLAKSYVNAQSMIGKSVRIPGEDSTPEQRAEFLDRMSSVDGVARIPDSSNPEEVQAFYRKLGCPEDSTKYQLEMPEGYSVDGFQGHIEAAHQAGLTNAQLQIMANAQLQTSAQQMEMAQRAAVDGKQVLQDTFGDQHTSKVADAKLAAKMYSEKFPDAVSELLNGPSGNNPALVVMLADLGSKLNEKNHSGTESTPSHGMSLKEVETKVSDLYRDEKFMKSWSDVRDPSHIEAKNRMDDLARIRHSLRNQ